MRILAFDSATNACSAALWEDGRITARRFAAMSRGQAEFLMPMIEEVMAEAGMGYPDLDLLAVTNGPGGFTGMRIGLAAGRAIALAAQLPCLGVTTLEAVAAGVEKTETKAGTLLVCLDSKRVDIFAQVFGTNLGAGPIPLGEAEAVQPNDLAAFIGARTGPGGPILVAGDAAGPAAKALDQEGWAVTVSTALGAPDAALVAAIAAQRWNSNSDLPPPSPPSPLYLRPPDAKIPKNGGRLRP